MPDFTSSLYLGLHHPIAALPSFPALTLGKPAALAPPPGEQTTARRLARLVGCEAALLGTSTLHLFWDLFGLLAEQRTAVYVDAGTYAVGRWGAERAAGRGSPIAFFRHHDPRHLARRLRAAGGRRPVVLTDGFCPGCGRPAPLAQYLELLRPRGGLLVLDDTQALGIWGVSPSAEAPYGVGGGGSLRLTGLGGENVLIVASLAKAFGAPLAVLAGSRRWVVGFARASETRMSSSPPSVVAVAAAARALSINKSHGESLRLQLVDNVDHLRWRLAQLGLPLAGGRFPVQSLLGRSTLYLYRALRRHGVGAVLQRGDGCAAGGPSLTLILTARHRPASIEEVAAVVGHATQRRTA